MRKDVEKKIESAIYALPLLPSVKEKIPETIWNIIRVSSFAGCNDLPRAKECSPEKAQKELDELANKIDKLRKHIMGMHGTSLRHFERDNVMHPLYIEHQLQKISQVAQFSFEGDEADIDQKKKRQAKQITDYLGKVFFELTGRKAARNVNQYDEDSGQYMEFVANVFAALNIEASAKSQVKQRSMQMYKKGRKKHA